MRRVWEENYWVYGAEKIWAQLNREELELAGERLRVARCPVERLMSELRIRGAVRGKKHRITIPSDKTQARPGDLVERTFKASGPNRLWVAD
ncbi:MAG: IS3 family transposase [Actinomycetota bacterium]|nr:IS3 family transposase [Actinomycetota bacterium]